jgi:hypothetical protein
MATYTVVSAKHATLSGTTVDIINLSSEGGDTIISNRAASGGADLTATVAYRGATAATPTAGIDNGFLVPAGFALKVSAGSLPVTQVQIIGNGQAYSVMQG